MNSATTQALLIKASAGTGKTTALANRYTALLLSGSGPEKILATTFTRKAASEIKTRVLSLLADCILDDQRRARLASDIGRSSIDQAELLKILRHLIDHLERLEVSTLDSFFIKIARSFVFELGLDVSWKILDARRSQQLHQQVLKQVLTDVDIPVIQTLVQIISSSLLVREVSTVLHRNISESLDSFTGSSLAAWNWAPVVAAEQINARVAKLIDQARELQMPLTQAGKPNANWQKSFSQSIVDLEEGNFEHLLEAGPVSSLLAGKDTFNKHLLEGAHREFCQATLDLLKDHYLTQINNENRALFHILQAYTATYEAERLRQQLYSFDDIKALLVNKLSADQLQDIYFRLDCRLQHVLLDEFQDTALLDWQALEPIAAEILNQLATGDSFFCVGDVKQAIYGWRGGVAEIFAELKQKWPILSELPLNKTYRCAPAIIEFVNYIFTRATETDLMQEYPKAAKHWREIFRPHESANAALEGYAAVEVLGVPDGEDHKQIIWRRAAELILETQKINPEVSIGILTRSNASASEAISFLRRECPNLEISEEGGVALSSVPCVQAFLALFRWLDHPADSISHFHLQHSILANVLAVPELQDASGMKSFHRQQRKGLFIEGYGNYTQQLVQALKKVGLSNAELIRLNQLVEFALQYSEQSDPRCTEFVKWLSLQKVVSLSRASVRIMTIHSSKGLEFDLVIAPDLDSALEGQRAGLEVLQAGPFSPAERIVFSKNKNIRALLPKVAEIHTSHVEEEVKQSLAVLYVMLTRARYGLHLLVAEKSSAKSKSTFRTLILEAAGSAGKPAAGILYSTGALDWRERCPGKGQVSSVVKVPVRLAFKKSELPPRSFSREAPSAYKLKRGLEVSEYLRLFNSRGVKLGTAVHAALAQVHWLDLPAYDAASVENLFRKSLPESLQAPEVLSYLSGALERPALNSILRTTAYLRDGVDRVEVKNESTFALKQKELVFTGSIDRLVLSYQGEQLIAAEVLDYKTDTIKDISDLKKKSEDYSEQLAIYKEAVAKIHALKPEQVTAKLVFLGNGEVVTV